MDYLNLSRYFKLVTVFIVPLLMIICDYRVETVAPFTVLLNVSTTSLFSLVSSSFGFGDSDTWVRYTVCITGLILCISLIDLSTFSVSFPNYPKCWLLLYTAWNLIFCIFVIKQSPECAFFHNLFPIVSDSMAKQSNGTEILSDLYGWVFFRMQILLSNIFFSLNVLR
jgi:hypothetical protein